MRLLIFAFAIAIIAAMQACSREPATPLVQKMEQAGAGDVRSASSQALEQWFRQHEDMAVEIDGTCRSLRANASANWRDTTDGRICAAAAKVHVFHYRPRPADGRTFQAGKK